MDTIYNLQLLNCCIIVIDLYRLFCYYINIYHWNLRLSKPEQ
jgi:hypothetical protein